MKKISILISAAVFYFLLPGSLASQAQADNSGEILQRYYAVKNALVSSNASLAATEASAFGVSLKKFDLNKQPAAVQSAIKDDLEILAKESTAIANTNNLARQRERFAVFSDAMIRVAKQVALSDEPVYVDYCPMKKSYWLSAEKPIRNPYYGSSMLTCGNIKDTLK